MIVGDRLSGWSDVFGTPAGTTVTGANALVRLLRSYFATFGVPEEISSDGGPEFTAFITQDFMRKWDIKHRVSSAYFPQSNGRAEVAVKAAKRLLMSNISPNGDLNNDSFLRALLQLRNTPDPDCDLSPAEIVFGHPLRDAFSFVNRLATFSNRFIRRTWREAWRAKEDVLRVRVEALDFGQYNVKVGGSGRITRRNRRFLRIIPDVAESQQTSSPPTVPPQHETHVQYPPSTSTHVADATSSEAIDHGQPQDVHDVVPTTTHSTFVTDTNSQETDPDTHENNKSMIPRRSSRLRRPAVELDPTSGQWVIKGSTT